MDVIVYVGIAVIIIGVMIIWMFNSMVGLRNLVAEGWSGVEVQLKRRHDLIPSLVETTKGYARHEKKLLEEITEKRNRQFSDPKGEERESSENELSKGLNSLLALRENYPDLKADQNFLHLQEQLTVIEEDLERARRYYNGTVKNFNIRVESFPANLLASFFGFSKASFFEIQMATEKLIPPVNLG